MSGHFKSNVRDLLFNLLEMPDAREHLGAGIYGDFDEELVRDILGEVAELAEGPLADTFSVPDREPPVFDPATHSVTLPESFRKSYDLLRASEWWNLETLPELGGQVAPKTLVWAVSELLQGANPALQMALSGPAFAGMIHRNGTEEQRKLAQLVVDRGWGTTMVLTEPDAGSDVGAIRTRAVPQDDGTWHIEGVKRFITNGEHDLADNIVHLVLARPAGAGPGTKGLSLFVVPKFHVDLDTGELDARNGVFATGIEHKMGLKGSATCELSFGQETGRPAVGRLLGDVHKGIAQMFQLIEHSRMNVGTKSMAALSTGYLNALEFARTRVQSADLAASSDPTAPRVTIIRHPEVRRSLMLGKAYAEGLRALVNYTATVQDRIAIGRDTGGDPSADMARSQLLLPVVKGVGSERSYEQLGQLLTLLGGSGYLRDYPLEQYVRDTRIDAIYEGTTAIQGNDFFFRQIVRDEGRAFGALCAEILGFAESVREASLTAPATALGEAVRVVEAMVAELRRVHRSEAIYRVGQNTTNLLLGMGDLMVGHLLIRQAQVAVRRLETADVPEADRSFYAGKVAVAQFFARTVLPELAVRLRVAESTDDSLMEVDETSF